MYLKFCFISILIYLIKVNFLKPKTIETDSADLQVQFGIDDGMWNFRFENVKNTKKKESIKALRLERAFLV